MSLVVKQSNMVTVNFYSSAAATVAAAVNDVGTQISNFKRSYPHAVVLHTNKQLLQKTDGNYIFIASFEIISSPEQIFKQTK